MELLREEPLGKISDETDDDLLLIISWKDEVKARNEAFTEFHRRYISFLYKVVQNVCMKFPNSYEMCQAITSNVLCNVYNYSASFNSEGAKDQIELRKRIERWLIGIAKTELKSLLTNYKIPASEEQKAYMKMMVATTKNESSYSFSEEIVKKAFSLLQRERDQHILLTYWMYYEKGNGSQSKNMPDCVLEELSKRYKTTKLNIRQIISRSNKTVKEYIVQNYKIENNVIKRIQ